MRHYAAEFEVQAENGLIRLPAEYPELANASLRVLVLSHELPQAQPQTVVEAERAARLERLRITQAKLVALNPYRDIIDPVQWQRELRNEDGPALPGRP